MAKVFVINLLVPDDEDTTQVMGVAATRDLAEKRIVKLKEAFVSDDDEESYTPEYEIEEHNLIES